MLRKHIANNIILIHIFLLSHLVSYLSYTSCDVRIKSKNPMQMHILDYCKYVVTQHDHLLTSGLTII